jgi:chromosome segregation ATPase
VKEYQSQLEENNQKSKENSEKAVKRDRANQGRITELTKKIEEREGLIATKETEIEEILIKLEKETYSKIKAENEKVMITMKNASQVLSLYDEYGELESKVEKLEEELKQIQADLEKEREENKELKEKVEELDLELTRKKTNEDELNKNLEVVGSEVGDLRLEKSNLEKGLEQTKTRIEELEKEINLKEEKINQLKKNYGVAITKTAQSINKRFEKEQGQHAETKHDLKKVEWQLVQKDLEITEINEKSARKTRTTEDKNEKYNILVEVQQKTYANLSQAEKKILMLQKEKSRVESNLSLTRDNLAAEQKEKNEKTKEKEKLISEKAELEEKLSLENKKSVELESKINDLTKNLETTESKKSSLYSELVENESRITIQDSELIRLKNELNKLEKSSEVYYENSEKKIRELEEDLAEARAALPEEVEITARKYKERITELTGISCARETNLTELEAKLGGTKLTALTGTLTEYLAQSQEDKKQINEAQTEIINLKSD